MWEGAVSDGLTGNGCFGVIRKLSMKVKRKKGSIIFLTVGKIHQRCGDGM